MIGSPSYEALQKKINRSTIYSKLGKKNQRREIRGKTGGYIIGFKGTFTKGRPFKFDEGGLGELALL